MESSFLYEAKGQTLIIHMPEELDHHNCRNLRYETDLLLAENYITRLIFDFSRTKFMDSSGIGVLLPGPSLMTTPRRFWPRRKRKRKPSAGRKSANGSRRN